jgi:hypothetical protein
MTNDSVWLVFFSIVLFMVLGVYFFRPERIKDHLLHRCSLGFLVVAFWLQILMPVILGQFLRSQILSQETNERRAFLCGGASTVINYVLVLLAMYCAMAATRPDPPESGIALDTPTTGGGRS